VKCSLYSRMVTKKTIPELAQIPYSNGAPVYLSGAIIGVHAVHQNRRLGHGDRGLLVPVGGDGGAHLQVAAEVGAVAVFVLDDLHKG
jgi:hypothetical protein